MAYGLYVNSRYELLLVACSSTRGHQESASQLDHPELVTGKIYSTRLIATHHRRHDHVRHSLTGRLSKKAWVETPFRYSSYESRLLVEQDWIPGSPVRKPLPRGGEGQVAITRPRSRRDDAKRVALSMGAHRAEP